MIDHAANCTKQSCRVWLCGWQGERGSCYISCMTGCMSIALCDLILVPCRVDAVTTYNVNVDVRYKGMMECAQIKHLGEDRPSSAWHVLDLQTPLKE